MAGSMNDSTSMRDLFLRLHAQQKANVLVSMVLIGAFVLMAIPNDFLFIKDPLVLALAIGLRLATIAILFLYCWVYLKKNYAALFYVVIPLLTILTLAIDLMLGLTRPRDYFFGSVGVFLILAVYYFIMHSSTLMKTIPALLITAEEVWLLVGYKDTPPGGLLTMLLALGLFNAFGISSSLVMNKLQKIGLSSEKALREELEFKEALANSGFEASLMFHDEVIVDCNQAFLDMVKLSLEQARVLSVSFFLVLTEEDRVRLANGEAVTTRLRGGADLPVEIRQRTIFMATQDYSCLIIRRLQGGAQESLALSQREKEIAALIVEGRTRSQIAKALHISNETVKSHTSNIYEKLDVSSKVDLIRKISQGQ